MNNQPNPAMSNVPLSIISTALKEGVIFLKEAKRCNLHILIKKCA